MGSTETPQEQLSREVRERRRHLGLSVRAAAAAANIDRATWTSLEDGSRVTQDRHYVAIEHALQWPTGYISHLLQGSATAEVMRPTPEELAEMGFEQLGVLGAEIERAEGYEAANAFFDEVVIFRRRLAAEKASQRN
ncbi:helix-turn-helix domain-containing protein [Amycolatopsis sp. H20-H5]|uniref:helix-turn-helix domain-containing protein n=1 Tax=Amycolatopsis sp. H20-H5 TaxID=3046309 RepID=UPI002DC06228|nr:helix-turn-helix domain-containing protein [Amycolatopsis sp. H20-H5]MEC3977870.1 helix-turn-helix domain-containing protein [Amycolatopsis sp. H20-H5]